MVTTIAQELKPNHTKSCDITPSIIREDDLMAHIEDTVLSYWVTRHNRAIKISWNEMTEQERAWQIEAQERAYYVEQFDPNYSYNY